MSRLYSHPSRPLSQLNEIKEQLRSFSEKQGPPGPVDNVQVGEDEFQLLEDLQEAILDHQVCLRSQGDTLSVINEDGRWRNKRLLTVRYSGRW